MKSLSKNRTGANYAAHDSTSHVSRRLYGSLWQQELNCLTMDAFHIDNGVTRKQCRLFESS